MTQRVMSVLIVGEKCCGRQEINFVEYQPAGGQSQGHYEEEYVIGGENPEDASDVKVGNADFPGSLALGQEQGGDQEAGDDEKDANTQVAVVNPPDEGEVGMDEEVPGEDERHRYGSGTVEGGDSSVHVADFYSLFISFLPAF